tara:strand:- start:1974 stop:2792 length:819 start_codon:yes stop_codon:yes gene_type:complete
MFKFIFSKTFLINILIILVVITASLWGIFKYLDSYTLNSKTISVPSLEGLTINEVEEVLSEKKLRYQILDSIYVENNEKGIVLEQQPSIDDLVKENRTIYITMSKIIPPKMGMPDVVDMSLRIAVAKIESYGLKVGKLSYFPSECVNCVLEAKINNKTVTHNQEIAKGSVIDLVLGSGTSSEKVFAPYLIGLSKEEALQKIQASFLNIGAEIYTDCTSKEDSISAKIFKQSPQRSENIVINMGSPIDIWFTCDTSKIKISVVDTLNLNLLDE